jgi:hypothetical protein
LPESRAPATIRQPAGYQNLSDEPDIFQLLVDAANAADLEFILIGGHAVNARGYARTTLDLDF